MITFAIEIKNNNMEEENKAVCVLDLNGERMMSTKRFGKVRRLLKAKLAKIVSHKPFTIKLLYKTKTLLCISWMLMVLIIKVYKQKAHKKSTNRKGINKVKNGNCY